jgi:hypothetical protein
MYMSCILITHACVYVQTTFCTEHTRVRVTYGFRCVRVATGVREELGVRVEPL